MPASINNNEQLISTTNINDNTNNHANVWSDDIWYGDDMDMEDFVFDSDFDTDCNGFDGFDDDSLDAINTDRTNNNNKPKIVYEGFYDEMNDLDSLYKQIHSPLQQSDVFNNVLLAILRPILYLICTLIFTLIISYIIANHYGYDLLQLITNILSSSHFLHNNHMINYNINSIFFNNGLCHDT